MFSNDQNIETIGQLVEALKHYIGLQVKYAKLEAVEKTVRLLTVATLTVVLSLLLLLALIFLSLAMAFALEPTMGAGGAFALVAGAYLLAFILCIAFLKPRIERRLVRFIASILMQE